MYSYELSEYLSKRRYSILPDEYSYICDTCPQIYYIKYDAFSQYFEIHTNDDYLFRFTVRKD